jgi:hypothetical protein
MLEFRPRTSRFLSAAVLAAVALEALGLAWLKELPFSRIQVINVNREQDLYWTPRPGQWNEHIGPPGVAQSIVAPDYSVLRSYRQAIRNDPSVDLKSETTDLRLAVALRQWARDQYDFNAGSGRLGMFDYDALLRNRLREGSFRESGLCDAFSTLFVGACLAFGLPARVIHLNTSAGIESQGHYTAEVYLSDHQQWVVMDPLYNCYYTAEGRPLSALDLHRFARRGQALSEIKVQPSRAATDPVGLPLDRYYQHFQVVARTDFDHYGLNLFRDKLLFLNWTGDGAAPLGRQEEVLRLLLFFIWPPLVLAVTLLLILGSRPRTSLLILSARKPVRPEYRE